MFPRSPELKGVENVDRINSEPRSTRYHKQHKAFGCVNTPDGNKTFGGPSRGCRATMSYACHVRVLIPLLPYLARDSPSRRPAYKELPAAHRASLPLLNVEFPGYQSEKKVSKPAYVHGQPLRGTGPGHRARNVDLAEQTSLAGERK